MKGNGFKYEAKFHKVSSNFKGLTLSVIVFPFLRPVGSSSWDSPTRRPSGCYKRTPRQWNDTAVKIFMFLDHARR